jgi:diguanylate cyclase (GGDEF)-like protein
MFPERNPSPVLQLDADGQVRYANPSAAALLDTLGLPRTSPRALLPADVDARLAAVRAATETRALWEYGLHDRVLECGAHWLADLRVFHVYVSDITARKRAEEQLVYQAYHDALTGLPNRRMFSERIEGILYGPQRAMARAAVLLIGVDRMKVIIDSLGHGIGDGLLRALAARLADTLRHKTDDGEGAQLYRFDGDLFCVLLPGFAAAETPVLLAERLIEATREPFYVDRRELHTSLSVGVAVYPLDGQDGAALLKNADTAMQRAKTGGGNGLQCYTRDMNDRAAEWLALENHLRHAEELGELSLHYQPQVDIASGRIVGVESLLRWQHPSRGPISPGVFIPLAEETGLISSLGDWVLRTACRQGCAWLDRGIGPITVAVNLSARQLHEPDLGRRIGAALAETGLPPELLEFEITESVAMHDIESTIETLQTLRQLKVRLSVDDFGTGFSSLSYLKRFPIDKLKIDQSFVRHLVSSDNDAAIAQAIIAMGHSLRLKVIAEGVTDPEQLARLRDWRCDQYQGYLYSAPLPAEEIDALLRTTTPAC